MPIIDFKATMCKHCYKCVRGCEVKSIMIRDGHAYIMPNRCILCGQCLLNCPQSAKRVPSELSKVKKLIGAAHRLLHRCRLPIWEFCLIKSGGRSSQH